MVILGKYIGSNKEANLFPLDETTIPVITGLASGSVSDTGFSVSALLSPGGLPSTWSVEYGLSASYGTTLAGGTSTEEAAISKALTGLQQNTLYHWRIKAVNSKGTSYSGDQTLTTTNISWRIPVTANTSGSLGTGVIVVSATEDFTPSTTGGVNISSTVRAADSTYRKHTITFTCALNQNGEIIIPDGTKIISCGSYVFSPTGYFYNPSTYAPKVTFNYSNLPNLLKIFQTKGVPSKFEIPANTPLPSTLKHLELSYENWTYSGALPPSLEVLNLASLTPNGSNGQINWTYNGALPTSLTKLTLDAVNINWTYSGSLPTGLTTLWLKKGNINWTYTGALPVNLISLSLNGTNINWTYSGALPSTLTGLEFVGENIRWTYTGALPTNLIALTLNGNNINWTYNGALPSAQLNGVFLIGSNIRWTYSGGFPQWCSQIYLDGSNINYTDTYISNNANFYTLSLLNFRITKMTSSTLYTMLSTLLGRDGGLPATITINDYLDYASPPQSILDIVAQIKATRGVTTVNLGA